MWRSSGCSTNTNQLAPAFLVFKLAKQTHKMSSKKHVTCFSEQKTTAHLLNSSFSVLMN